MKRDDRFRRNNLEDNRHEPTFEDSSYQQDMRVDPLTTLEAIKSEISELKARQAERVALAKQKEAEKEAELRIESQGKELADDPK